MQDRENSRRDQVASSIRKLIVDGQLAPGDSLPTRAQLQVRFAAGPMTIHHAIAKLVDEGFVISQRGARTQVVPSPPHTSRYGLVMSEAHEASTGCDNRFHQAFQLAASQFNRLHPHHEVRLYTRINSHADCEDFARLANDIQLVRLAGAIFVHPPHNFAHHWILEQDRVPIVNTGSDSVGNSVNLPLNPDLAINQMARCLKEAGRKSAACVHNLSDPAALEHLVQLFESHGIALPAPWRVQCSLAFPSGARDLTRLIFSFPSAQRPDSLIITDDNLTEHAIGGLLDAGARIPTDVTVVSHWNFPLPQPRLVPFYGVGLDARELLRECVSLCDEITYANSVQSPRPTTPPDFTPTILCENGLGPP